MTLKKAVKPLSGTNATRKNSPPIKVYCLPEEKAEIEALARQAGVSAARYLREVGLGYRVEGITDSENVRELARINGDLGRLGGLLKLWLTNDERTARYGEGTIRALLHRIGETQDEMGKVMMKVVMPKTDQ